MADARLWLDRPVPCPGARQRLVCFPHAGGSAAFFRDWGRHLPGTEVLAVRYPGRAERIDEPSPTDITRLGTDAATALLEGYTGLPLVLFGHSMGAVVALEAARALQRNGVTPGHLVVSGSRNAPLPEPGEESAESDEEVAERLAQLGGTDPAALADPFFRELVLPYIQDDGKMFHAYEHRAEPVLHCPVTAIVGDVDVDADRRPWAELTDRGFTERIVAGHHFYLIDRPPYGLLLDTTVSAR